MSADTRKPPPFKPELGDARLRNARLHRHDEATDAWCRQRGVRRMAEVDAGLVTAIVRGDVASVKLRQTPERRRHGGSESWSVSRSSRAPRTIRENFPDRIERPAGTRAAPAEDHPASTGIETGGRPAAFSGDADACEASVPSNYLRCRRQPKRLTRPAED